MKPPHPATARQSGRENSVRNKHFARLRSLFLLLAIGSAECETEVRLSAKKGKKEKKENTRDESFRVERKYKWFLLRLCTRKEKNPRTCVSAKTESEAQRNSLWPILRLPWCNWLFIINISCRSSCMFKGTQLYCSGDAPPPPPPHLLCSLRASSELLIPRAHVNLTWTTPITRQKQSISDIGRVGESGITQTLSAHGNKDGDFLCEDD